ncbi:homeotic protein female sterile [Drosophila grimshawi]|uniref:homeotic protein female sterile n=1 Tax=Drosophila grimshawi TaxID=7222 RepID=UPI0013EF0296|nr:homeotic protein female sterile [Drosophila grimshawi]
MAILQQGTAIVGAGRDLVLTPKQSLQLSGKRIYYGEQAHGHGQGHSQGQEQEQQQTARPWERTLKHVTYVTLFTDAALGAAAGNLSQLHDYHDFLQTPYQLPAERATPAASSRFGDIVNVASGRLEQLMSNGSYRFVEGNAPTPRNVELRALWHVQRIRHRVDVADPRYGQRYHYELKFSVTPSIIGYPAQSFIQRESDYPQSFASPNYREQQEQAFRAQRRQDRQPQATFVRGIFQAPPNLNIGEYVQTKPDGSHLPGLAFNLGLRPNFIPATTYRPSYPAMLKFGPRPNQHHQNPLEPYPLTQDAAVVAAAAAATGDAGELVGQRPVTHHFHHHFYMSPAGLAQDLTYRPSTYANELSSNPVPAATEISPAVQLHQHRYQQQQQQQQQQLEQHGEVQFPTNREPAEQSTESLETSELAEVQQQQEEQHPLLSGFEQSPKYHSTKLTPLLIYASGSAQDVAQDAPKSFVQSEPLEETIYRYSEPDPLYVNQHPLDVLQLETVDQRQQQQHQEEQQEEQQEEGQEDERQQTTLTGEHEIDKVQPEDDLETESAGSQKQHKLAPTTTTAATATAATTVGTSTLEPTTSTSLSASFVSTSTNLPPLRALSRYRTTNRKSTTTTTTTAPLPAISKWRQRRKENISSSLSNGSSSNVDSKPKSSHRHEAKVATTTPAATTTATTTTTTTAAAAATTTNSAALLPLGEIIEVLTQKSVSKSVSIKVGPNGEEIPIIIDDDDDNENDNHHKNEVKHS